MGSKTPALASTHAEIVRENIARCGLSPRMNRVVFSAGPCAEAPSASPGRAELAGAAAPRALGPLLGDLFNIHGR